VFFLKKKIFYTKLYFANKAHKEEMEVEGERVKKTRNSTSRRPSKPKLGGTRLMLNKK